MDNLNPNIATRIELLIYERQQTLKPRYLTLVPTIDSELDFYYIPYLDISSDQSMELAIYDYFKQINMYFWSYQIQTQSVTASRLNDETTLNRNVCITASVEDMSDTKRFSQQYQGDTVNSFSLRSIHEKLNQSPYYGEDLRKAITLLKLAQRSND